MRVWKHDGKIRETKLLISQESLAILKMKAINRLKSSLKFGREQSPQRKERRLKNECSVTESSVSKQAVEPNQRSSIKAIEDSLGFADSYTSPDIANFTSNFSLHPGIERIQFFPW